jgi:hypothetical protein
MEKKNYRKGKKALLIYIDEPAYQTIKMRAIERNCSLTKWMLLAALTLIQIENMYKEGKL